MLQRCCNKLECTLNLLFHLETISALSYLQPLTNVPLILLGNSSTMPTEQHKRFAQTNKFVHLRHCSSHQTPDLQLISFLAGLVQQCVFCFIIQLETDAVWQVWLVWQTSASSLSLTQARYIWSQITATRFQT